MASTDLPFKSLAMLRNLAGETPTYCENNRLNVPKELYPTSKAISEMLRGVVKRRCLASEILSAD
jgi:hypothetical protein